jgi:ribosome-binding protein aMBF1 (putative translation factor)
MPRPGQFQKGHARLPGSGPKRNRYPERIYWEEVKQTLGLSTFDLAHELGVCVRTVECWERGEKNYRGAAKRPPPPVMKLVAKLLEIHAMRRDLDEMFSSISEPKPPDA